MRGRAVAEIEHDLVDVAPTPAFGRVIAFDHRMPCRVEVPRRVPVRRVVAASDMAASPTQAQMQPSRADLQTFLAPERTPGHVADVVRVSAFVRHQGPPIRAGSALLSV